MRSGLAIFLSALAAAASAARANDTTAELTTGGLVLTSSADIEMRAEDLAISEREIAVSYRFFNASDKDETVTVAFPMPDIVWGPDANIAVPDPEAVNFLDFRTLVGGREVETRSEQKAMADGRDISEKLSALGVPLAPQSQAAGKALDALPASAQDELVGEKIATPDDYDVGKGWEHHLAPNWTLKTTFYWSQTFPAGRELRVEHRYKPSVGETTGTGLQLNPIDPQEMKRYQSLYCVDSAFLGGLSAAGGRRDAQGNYARYLFERRIAYVLTTGANWAGPIGDFHLTIDKGAPDNLISFCADGVKKTSPTRFEVRHENFVPRRDLNILILYRPRT